MSDPIVIFAVLGSIAIWRLAYELVQETTVKNVVVDASIATVALMLVWSACILLASFAP